jgi:hypothetical protein
MHLSLINKLDLIVYLMKSFLKKKIIVSQKDDNVSK